MVTDANFTEVLEIQISLLVISISLNLKVQSQITTSRFTGAQRMLLYYFYIKNEMAMWATGNLYSPVFDQSIVRGAVKKSVFFRVK